MRQLLQRTTPAARGANGNTLVPQALHAGDVKSNKLLTHWLIQSLHRVTLIDCWTCWPCMCAGPKQASLLPAATPCCEHYDSGSDACKHIRIVKLGSCSEQPLPAKQQWLSPLDISQHFAGRTRCSITTLSATRNESIVPAFRIQTHILAPGRAFQKLGSEGIASAFQTQAFWPPHIRSTAAPSRIRRRLSAIQDVIQ
jgi:hypothetical protein